MQLTIKINNTYKKIQLRKSKRAKRLQLKVYRNGEVIVVIPFRYSYREAKIFLEGQINWIEKKLSKLAFYTNKFRYLGYETKLSITTEKKDKRFVISYDDIDLIFPTVDNQTSEQLFESWLFEEAKRYIPLRTQQLAELYGFKFNKVRVKKLKSRWGSCSSKNNLSFNYKLMHFNTKVIDYVIVHELCHLIEMNHSKNFWLLVQKIIPDYKVCKRELSFYHQT